MKKVVLMTTLMGVAITMSAQSITHYTTTDQKPWVESKTKLADKAEGKVVATVNGTEKGVVFRAWGTTFNELDWDAFNLLSRDEQDEVMRNLF